MPKGQGDNEVVDGRCVVRNRREDVESVQAELLAQIAARRYDDASRFAGDKERSLRWATLKKAKGKPWLL